MCENPDSKTTLRRLEERLLMQHHRNEGRLEIDESRVYFKGKAIFKEAWRSQSLQIGMPPDIYLDIAALAKNERGYQVVNQADQKFLVGLGGIVHSRDKPYREVTSVARYD